MNTCGDCPRWPAARSHSSQALERAFAKQASERAFAGQALGRAHARILSGGRHLELWNVGTLTCAGGNGLTRLGLWRAKAHHAQPSTRGVRGFDSAELPHAEKAAELHSHLVPKAPSSVAADRPEAGDASSNARPLEVRMTARWSGVARGNASAKSASDPTGDLEIERWRVSHSARRAVSRGDVCHGCSWRETSVVEASSRHLDAVIEGWPRGRTRHGVERRRRPVARNGAGGHCPAQKGATGRQRPKGWSRPLGDGTAITSSTVIGPKSRIRGRRVGS
jgi:hypothetical protein